MENWINLSQTAGTGNATITVSASSYSALTSRVTSLTVSGLSASTSVSILQNGAPATPDDCLTLSIISAGTIVWTLDYEPSAVTIQYSLNDGEWTSITSSYYNPPSISVFAGDIVRFKGNNAKLNYSRFDGSTAYFNVYGNIMSLLDSSSFSSMTSFNGNEEVFCSLFSNTNVVDASELILPVKTLTKKCYQGMFQGCSNLTQAPEIPATVVASNSCHVMFANCTSLTSAPYLSATTIGIYCYSFMFDGCTSLTQVQDILPATELADGCYDAMFQGCSSLTKAPVLPALSLTLECYSYMFSGCRNLNYIKCLAAYISPTDCTKNWTYNVSPTGTFVKTPYMSGWTVSTSGIPTGWVVEDDDSFITGLSINNLVWVRDVPYSGGTADKTNCEYDIFACYNDGILLNVTNNATVSGSIVVPATIDTTRQSAGTLTLTAEYSGFTTSESVTAYQEAHPSELSISNLTWIVDVPSYGGTADKNNCSYSVLLLFNDGTIEDVTSAATVTGSLSIPSTTAETRTSAGTLTLTANYIGMSASASVVAYQEAFAQPISSYLTFEIVSAGTITWGQIYVTGEMIEYSLNGGNWTSIVTNLSNPPVINVYEGDYVQFRGNHNTLRSASFSGSTAYFNVSGNVCSLLDATNFSAMTDFTETDVLYGLFRYTNVIDASQLVLPVTGLTEGCYSNMFSGCTSLTTPPTLSATTLARYCYNKMFYGCTNLNYVKCLATDISANNCTTNWLSGVSPTGTFVKNPSMNDWTTGASGIPSGWTVIDAT